MYTPITDAQTFKKVVTLGVTQEGQWLDFKAKLNHQGRENQEELARDVAQFANTDGGVLLIGVSEGQDPRGTGIKVAKGIAPVVNPPGVEQWVHEALSNCLYPSTIPLDVRVIVLPEGVVVAINVPPYPDIVVVRGKDDDTQEFVRRTSHGKKPMSFGEVELHQMKTSRAAKIALQMTAAEASHEERGWPVVLTPQPPVVGRSTIANEAKPYSAYLLQLHERYFTLRFEHPQVHREGTLHIPYSLVRDAWVTHEKAIGLFLDAGLAVDSKGIWMLTAPAT